MKIIIELLEIHSDYRAEQLTSELKKLAPVVKSYGDIIQDIRIEN